MGRYKSYSKSGLRYILEFVKRNTSAFDLVVNSSIEDGQLPEYNVSAWMWTRDYMGSDVGPLFTPLEFCPRFQGVQVLVWTEEDTPALVRCIHANVDLVKVWVWQQWPRGIERGVAFFWFNGYTDDLEGVRVDFDVDKAFFWVCIWIEVVDLGDTPSLRML